MQSKHRLGITILSLSLILIGSGCASLVDGNKQSIYIESQVENAEVYIDQKFAGETPVTIEVSRQSDLVLEIRKKNYQTRKLKIKGKMSGYFWLNLPFTVLGTTGMSTDYGTGSMYEYDPDSYLIELKPLPSKKTSGADFRTKLFRLTNQRGLAAERARHQRGTLSLSLEHLKNIERISK